MSEILLFPYLPLKETVVIGPWELIPHGDIDKLDLNGEVSREVINKLFDLFVPPDGRNLFPLGTLAHRRSGRHFTSARASTVHALRRAVVVAMLNSNPPAERRDGSSGFAGHLAISSDNAALYGIPISGKGTFAVEYGELIRRRILGVGLERDDCQIGTPVELPVPLAPIDFDGEYAHAVYSVLRARNEALSRRIARVIDWLDLAWRNTESITQDMRVVALFFGFEVLLETSRVERLAKALSKLLDKPGAKKRKRQWANLKGGLKKPKRITDLNWWFIKFGNLRNSIVHGDKIPRRMYLHGKREHFWLGEQRLREAIAKVVSKEVKKPELEHVSLYDRALYKAAHELTESVM